MKCSGGFNRILESSRSCEWKLPPGGPTRFECTWRPWDIRSWAILCTEHLVKFVAAPSSGRTWRAAATHQFRCRAIFCMPQKFSSHTLVQEKRLSSPVPFRTNCRSSCRTWRRPLLPATAYNETQMDRSRNTCIVLVVVWVSVLTGRSAAQSGNDLPSAPSAVIQQEKAPPVPAPTPSKSNSDAAAEPAGSTQPDAQQPNSEHPNTETKAEAKPADQTAVPDEGRPTIPVRVNEVNVVFTVTDK